MLDLPIDYDTLVIEDKSVVLAELSWFYFLFSQPLFSLKIKVSLFLFVRFSVRHFNINK